MCSSNCVMEGLIVEGVQTLEWTTLALLAAHLQAFLPAGNEVQRSVKRVTLRYVSLDVVCEVVRFFGHVEELTCGNISNPKQVCLYVCFASVSASCIFQNLQLSY